MSTKSSAPDTDDTNYWFVVGVFNIDCSSQIRGGINLGNDLRLIKDSKHVRSICQPFADSLGNLELRSLTRNPLTVIGQVSIRGSTIEKERAAAMYAQYVLNYTRHLWLVKDCSPMLEQAYLLSSHPVKERRRLSVHANRVMQQPTCADGTARIVLFSQAELEAFRTRSRSTLEPGLDRIGSNSEGWWRAAETAAGRGSSRLDRCLAMIDAARSSLDLGIKAAQYCASMEALLASGTSELRHQLAERVAWLYPSTNRLSVYGRMQKLYDLRSRILHGDVVPKNADLTVIVNSADQLCRTIVVRALSDQILSDALSSEDRLRDFYLSKLLGLKSSDQP